MASTPSPLSKPRWITLTLHRDPNPNPNPNPNPYPNPKVKTGVEDISEGQQVVVISVGKGLARVGYKTTFLRDVHISKLEFTTPCKMHACLNGEGDVKLGFSIARMGDGLVLDALRALNAPVRALPPGYGGWL
jgi:hypothetical protein